MAQAAWSAFDVDMSVEILSHAILFDVSLIFFFLSFFRLNLVCFAISYFTASVLMSVIPDSLSVMRDGLQRQASEAMPTDVWYLNLEFIRKILIIHSDYLSRYIHRHSCKASFIPSSCMYTGCSYRCSGLCVKYYTCVGCHDVQSSRQSGF